MKNKFLSMSCAVALASTMFISCSKEEAASDSTNEQDMAKMEEKLVNLGFNTDDLQKISWNGEEGYLIERDIFLTADQIEEMTPAVSVSNNEINAEHYRTTNVVSTPRTVSVYMDAEFNATMQAAFDDALNRYNSLGLDITFQKASSEGADIDILSEKLKRAPGGYVILGRSAGFPDASGDPATPIVLNSDIYNPRRGGIPADAATVIAHEIGHAIGFRHTDYMDRSFSCGTGGDEGAAGVGAEYIPGTPAGPENGSWMLACSGGTDRPFTSGDVTALNTVY